MKIIIVGWSNKTNGLTDIFDKWMSNNKSKIISDKTTYLDESEILRILLFVGDSTFNLAKEDIVINPSLAEFEFIDLFNYN